MKRPAVIVLSPGDLALGEKIAGVIGGEIACYRARIPDARNGFTDLGRHLRECFRDGRPIVAILAAGALIRLLAPELRDKTSEPPVLAVSADGRHVVPLLGGHHGANRLATEIAIAISAQAAITTAGDARLGVALDDPLAGYRLGNPQDAKAVTAALLAGEKVGANTVPLFLAEANLPAAPEGKVRLTVTENARMPEELELVYYPRTLALGIGCERGSDPDEAIRLAEQTMADAKLSALSLACVASLDIKADEPAIHAVADHFGVPARFFDAATLEAETPRLANPSDVVFAGTGCHGVAEGAALAAVGADGELIAPKRKSKRATAAIARAPAPILVLPGRARGRLFVVGIGPGGDAWRSPEASDMLATATDWVGYRLYLDLIEAHRHGESRHDFDLGREEDRVRHAMELAATGRDVALVCSGDAGIYAMATLVFELLEQGGLSDVARRIEIAVAPGISALQAAAARAGAPLGHDFCTLSLSDVLTPWPDIQKRVRAAAQGDFVIAFYNPVSKRRRTQLAWAREELLRHRAADIPVVIAANLGRDGETVRMTTLGQLRVDEVDMLTVVLVGSSQTRVTMTGDGRQWVYTPRGYAGKASAGREIVDVLDGI